VTFEIVFTPEASLQLASERAWWVENRPAASALFDEELDQALEQLQTMAAALPVFIRRRGREIRRRLLPKTRCHVYYEVREHAGRVIVLSVWGARRGRLPRLPPGTR
jgi:plasmid stabilization system protein ParE